MYKCEYCGKDTDGCYIDRGMFFCDSECANKEWKKRHNIKW